MARHKKLAGSESKNITSLLKEDGEGNLPVSTQPKKLGRPAKDLDPEEVAETLKKCRGLLYLAATALGVHHTTLSRFIEADEELNQIYKEERGKTLDRAEAKLMQAVDAGEQWAITMILRTLGRERGYVERQEVASVAHVKLEIVEEIVDGTNRGKEIKVDAYIPKLPETFVEEVEDGEER